MFSHIWQNEQGKLLGKLAGRSGKLGKLLGKLLGKEKEAMRKVKEANGKVLPLLRKGDLSSPTYGKGEVGQIEKGVPMPKARGAKRDGARFPFADMEVGGSFETEAPANSITTAAWYFTKAHGGKFSIRTVGEGKRRCWRVA